MVDTPTVWKPLHQVNTGDTGDQEDPIAIDIGMGRYVVIWEDDTFGTSAGDDLVGQIFDARGNLIGSQFQVNQGFTLDTETDASLASRPGGGFVMVYEDTDGSGTSIRAETYDVNGVRVTTGVPTVIAPDPGAPTISNPEIAMRPDGSYLVAYQTSNNAGDTDIVGRIVDTSGVVSGQFTIFDQTDDTTDPDAAALTNGNYVVVYEDEFGGSTTDIDVKFTIVNPTGAVVTAGVIDTGLSIENDPHVAALTGGGFVVTYQDDDGDGAGNPGIKARVFDNNGVALGAAFTVNTTTTGNQNEPDITALADGGFVVVWDDDNAGLLRAQRYDAAGNKVGAEFLAGTVGSEVDPTAALLGDGRFIIPFEQDTGDDDAHATIFDPRTGPIDGTSGPDILTSRKEGAAMNGMGGKDILLGDDGVDIIKGGGGKDIISGGLAKNKMWGNGGKDWFVFDTELGAGNKGIIKDFKTKKEKIFLDEDIFDTIGAKLGKKEFVEGKKAKDGNDHIIYKNGKLYYDEDGKGGDGKVLFAKLKGKPDDLTHKNFIVDDFSELFL